MVWCGEGGSWTAARRVGPPAFHMSGDSCEVPNSPEPRSEELGCNGCNCCLHEPDESDLSVQLARAMETVKRAPMCSSETLPRLRSTAPCSAHNMFSLE